jgi:hypothetical protein
MKLLRVILLVALLISTATNTALSQSYHTPFITSITYQNTGTSSTTVTFKFYVQGSSSFTTVTRTIAAGAGSSLFVDANSLGLPRLFMGSVVMSSNQNVVATLVQSPDSINVKNRSLSNAFKAGSTKVMLPTLLKSKFNTTSKFSVQNVTASNVNVTVKIYNTSDPSTPAYTLPVNTLPGGATKYFVMGDGNGDPGAIAVNAPDNFEGSATIEGVLSGTSTSVPLAATVFELSQTDWIFSARAYEGIGSGANTLYMASALCKSFNTTTAYAVQNVGSTNASVTVTYSNGTPQTGTIAPNGKASFNACSVNGAGFSGAAKIVSSGGQIVAIGKKFIDNPSTPDPNYGTAFLGETQGSAKRALPYVRYTADATYNNGSRQRAFLAIQNVGANTVTNVQVKYIDNAGTVIGTHTIASINSNAKANSRAIDATGNAAKLQEFGYPQSNPDGGFGGSVIIEATSGSQLIAMATVASRDTNTGRDVAEDYNAIQIP